MHNASKSEYKVTMIKLDACNFFTEDTELPEKYNGIWNKVSNSAKKELDCKPTCSKKVMKTKKGPSGDEAPDFHDK